MGNATELTVNSSTSLLKDGNNTPQDIEKGSTTFGNNVVGPVEQPPPPDEDLVNWNGPDDPQNPMNWSTAKKITAIGIVSLITFLS